MFTGNPAPDQIHLVPLAYKKNQIFLEKTVVCTTSLLDDCLDLSRFGLSRTKYKTIYDKRLGYKYVHTLYLSSVLLKSSKSKSEAFPLNPVLHYIVFLFPLKMN